MGQGRVAVGGVLEWLNSLVVRTRKGNRQRLSDSLGQRRKFGFWYDREVRSFLDDSYGRYRLDDVVGVAVEMFGPMRAPSRSAIGRYFLALDQAQGLHLK